MDPKSANEKKSRKGLFLYLEDGTKITGQSFGANINVAGEVVFATGMVGYPESFTDPSYAGQILVLTYPLIGNYGVPFFAPPSRKATDGHGKATKGRPIRAPFESDKVQIAGLVVSEYSEKYSHHSAKQSLGEWLRSSGVPALTGVDTRALTKKLREKGVMLGVLGTEKPKKFIDPNEQNLVAKVSPKKKRVYGKGRTRIVVVDCGIKENIVRSLIRPDTTVIRVPWDYDFTGEKYHALVLGNGPGDPTRCGATIEHVKKAMAKGKPILGVCLGNQLLALAAGASTYKLKYGHRSQNQPCIEKKNGRCYITSQNHGFAVDTSSLPPGWEEWFVNANDGSNEGIRHKTRQWRSVQFHPEACPGPTDTRWIFDEFLDGLKKKRV